MPRKSSKTAHVLNLLTSNKESDSEDQIKPVQKKASKKESAPKEADDIPVPAEPETGTDNDILLKADMPAPELTQDEETPESIHTAADVNDISEQIEEIIPEIMEDSIHISEPIEAMSATVKEILSEPKKEPPQHEMQTINPVLERMRDYDSTPVQATESENITSSNASDETKTEQTIISQNSGSFSYVPPNIIPTPMPKSAVASMLIAQKKAEEKQEEEPQPQEITTEVPVYEDEEMTLVNLTEKSASKRIPEIMQKFNMCTCERCYYDVLALTLNGIPQKTVIVPKDDIERKISEYELDATVDLVTAISKSCVHVKISPRHQNI